MRSSSAALSLFSLSANNAETDINTFQDIDTSLICGMDNILKLDAKRETDTDEANGVEEASKVYHRGNTSSVSLAFEKMMAQHGAMFLAYALGNCVSVAQGAGYEHTITPRDGHFDYERDQLGFTGAQKLGGVVKRRFASLFVDSVDITYSQDQFAKLSAGIKGTGKFETNVTQETVNAAGNSTSLILAANAAFGSTAEERLDAIHQVTVELTSGVKTEVKVTAVSGATPAELTITDPGGDSTIVKYVVSYVPDEAAWCSLPPTVDESPLLVCGLNVVVGGTWNGAAFVGGRNVSSQITEVTYSLQNSLSIMSTPGGCINYSNKVSRPARKQMIKLNKEMRDYILQLQLENNETFGIELDLIGDDYATEETFQMKTVIPKLGVIDAPISVKDKKLAEAGDLLVLDGGVYPSTTHTVRNQISQYAQ